MDAAWWWPDALVGSAALRRHAHLGSNLARRGVHVSNASAAFVGQDAPHLHGFRVAYAYLSEAEMRSALTILADALRSLG